MTDRLRPRPEFSCVYGFTRMYWSWLTNCHSGVLMGNDVYRNRVILHWKNRSSRRLWTGWLSYIRVQRGHTRCHSRTLSTC